MRIKLHYVNAGKLYGADVFKKEAQAIGVNRCLPLPIIKHIKWNDRILLATYEPKTLAPEDTRDGRGNKRNGTAHVFGYVTVTGLSYAGASAEFGEALTSLLSVEALSRPKQTVHRQCGSYTVNVSCTVNNSIEDIICKAQNLANKRVEKVKFFVSGTFTPLELTIMPVNFARGVITVEIDWHDTEPQDLTVEVLKIVNTLTDYNKRAYIKTHEKRGRPRKAQ
jgi:hypothetical protein